MVDSAKAKPEVAKKERTAAVNQTDFPSTSLEKALMIPRGLWDNYAGKSAAPLDLALSLEVSPASSNWRMTTGASIAYGLTSGGYNAKEIGLTELGRRLVAPLEEGDDLLARSEAVLRPKILRDFFSRYDGAKFPKDEVAKNVLISMGIPKDRGDQALRTLIENGKYAGLIRDTKAGLFVSTRPHFNGTISSRTSVADHELDAAEIESEAPQSSFLDTDTRSGSATLPVETLAVRRVFITHGKNLRILEQIKEIVRYGKFDPVVSVEHETISKPVPDKVMEDMRSCQAAIIHVAQEGVLADTEGNLVPQVNGNVLIEIGAAMALYGRKFILLVEDGVKLPSNLQGLYECRYNGDSLDGFATMKLLKAFNDFA